MGLRWVYGVVAVAVVAAGLVVDGGYGFPAEDLVEALPGQPNVTFRQFAGVDRDVPAMYEFLWSHGLISDELENTIRKDCDFSSYSFVGTRNESQYQCYDDLDESYEIASNHVDIYGVIYDECYPSIVEQELRLRKMATKMSYGIDICRMYETSFYLNLPEVQKALHANRTNLRYNWSDCSK
ncbi:Serine carboxypeptidase-like 42 [Striga hermonthica]|uniref:Serine carboxypeptidase-like 42 n=1 Tax=Striga hermonthica TaxID=68872 RepID=A0A9N7MQI2_STRHE|nr:Serine carboxypeptidase-like 42 [Striga hermonthica]